MALTPHVALLRAVNVGGRKAVMAELRAMLTELGFEAPQTLLQSGNAVFCSAPTGEELEAQLERAFAARFGFETDFMVRTGPEWAAIVAANPHAAMAKGDPAHLVVMAMKSAPAADAVVALRAAVQGPEVIGAVGRELYITYPGGIGTSKLTGSVIERKLGVRGTARNWNTVTKLAALLAG
ncbi:MAG TPA: DUF1697 domain-containing protein [Caulobacteraceae bacterium]|jgi:uncharacterized protein (DUF1697 family)